jgi:hypothetical protein
MTDTNTAAKHTVAGAEFIACCILVDCEGETPYLASREASDEPQLYDTTDDARIDAFWIERENGAKCKVVPILRGSPSWMGGLDHIPGVKRRDAVSVFEE